jgi:hypothetical protein
MLWRGELAGAPYLYRTALAGTLQHIGRQMTAIGHGPESIEVLTRDIPPPQFRIESESANVSSR